MLVQFSRYVSAILKTCILAVSSMHFFAMVIILSFLSTLDRKDISEVELAMIISAHTCGTLLAMKWTEFTLKYLSMKITINIGFFILTSASFGLWGLINRLENERDDDDLQEVILTSSFFITRFIGGFGSGLLSTGCLMINALDVDA